MDVVSLGASISTLMHCNVSLNDLHRVPGEERLELPLGGRIREVSDV